MFVLLKENCSLSVDRKLFYTDEICMIHTNSCASNLRNRYFRNIVTDQAWICYDMTLNFRKLSFRIMYFKSFITLSNNFYKKM